jgi:hypothetical protein
MNIRDMEEYNFDKYYLKVVKRKFDLDKTIDIVQNKDTSLNYNLYKLYRSHKLNNYLCRLSRLYCLYQYMKCNIERDTILDINY